MPKPIHRPEYAVVRRLLTDIRHEAQLTQEAVAEALGQPQPYMSTIEAGQRRIDIIELRDLCRALGVSLDDFVRRLEAALAAPTKSSPVKRRRVDRRT
ncbi:helix-turn-helix domain-containing protein [Pseudoxanthomonas sacheonensis]|uniref:helix-turn-helix domain-containing protein n=1 Tax=Pseudoxanthomonas sacheonensis TaxID=443615 RepID=UPI0013D6D4FC|nr:helix-turn-helix transcriptional regulator [Pseudoxanthomonas sacheonensis]KAF1710185.1 transcriptional regulator [Pseudoxanthomonas sacheonensis]